MSAAFLDAGATLLKFLAEEIIWVFFAFVIMVFRRPLNGLLERIISFRFSRGKSSLEIEAPRAYSAKDQDFSDKQAEPPGSRDKEASRVDRENSPLNAFIDCLSTGDTEKARNLYRQHVEDLQCHDVPRKTDPLWLYFGYMNSASQWVIDELKTVALHGEDDRDVVESVFWLDGIYRTLNATESREELWDQLISRCVSENSTTQGIIGKSKLLLDIGRTEDARSLLIDRLSDLENRSGKSDLLAALAETFQREGNNQFSALLRERAISLTEWTAEQAFDLGYFESNNSLPRLAAANYEAILSLHKDHDIARNNLAVIAQEGSFPIVAANQYKVAAGNGNTLAMANLGYIYLNAGLEDDAKAEVERALGQEKVHDNIFTLRAEIERRSRKQSEDWERYLRDSRVLQRFVREYARAHEDVNFDAEAIDGSWRLASGDKIQLQIDSGRIEARWKIGPSLRGTNGCAVVKGSIVGRSIDATYRVENKPDETSLLAYSTDTKNRDLLGWFSEDGSFIEFAQVSDTQSFFLKFVRRT